MRQLPVVCALPRSFALTKVPCHGRSCAGPKERITGACQRLADNRDGDWRCHASNPPWVRYRDLDDSTARHGEDLYVTIDIDQFKSDPDQYRDKCVRIRLKEGELMDCEVDCLQLQVETPPQNVDLSVDYDAAFDMKGLAERPAQKPACRKRFGISASRR